MKTVFITGTAGFIGHHLANELLDHGFDVVGFDAMTDYYDVSMKRERHAQLAERSNHFRAFEARLEDMDALTEAYEAAKPDFVVHLAAQAGVRYSLENPRSYVESNILGTFNLMELTREHKPEHFLFASTSSVYGGNTEMPFTEMQRCDSPLTIYAATKKASEELTHSYSHLYGIPTTGFRFFTVYGPWLRPDLALYKFVNKMQRGEPIDIYNHGDMARDFTYVGDLVRGIRLLMGAVPPTPDARADWERIEGDTLSNVAAHRVVNIGNGEPVQLLDFVDCIEAEMDIKAKRNYMDMQPGDVPATHASNDLLRALTGFKPEVSVPEGVKAFVDWYKARLEA